MSTFEKELRHLKIYATLMTFVCAVLFGLVFHKINSGKFDEIDV